MFDESHSEEPDFTCICQGCSGLHHLEGAEISTLRLLRRELSSYDTLRYLGRLVEKLPPKEICDQLWEAFINTVYPLIPILHLPTFYEQYDDLWRSLDELRRSGTPTGILADCPTFLALLFSALFCGCFHSCFLPLHSGQPQLSLDDSEKQLSRDLYQATMQALTVLGFPSDPTIYTLSAFLIWHVPLIREETERSTAFVCTAFRVGQALGLHRDPKHFQASEVEAEIRRRVWWHILHKDTRMLPFRFKTAV